jgi:hypothetical protein
MKVLIQSEHLFLDSLTIVDSDVVIQIMEDGQFLSVKDRYTGRTGFLSHKEFKKRLKKLGKEL